MPFSNAQIYGNASSNQPYNAKIVRGNGWIEGVEFSRPLTVGATSEGGSRTGMQRGQGVPCSTGRDPEERAAENKARSVQRSKTTVRRKVKQLYGQNDGKLYMLTLTYADNMQDIDQAQKDFRAFKRRLKKRGIDFQYIAVLERQKRGAWHFHILTNVYLEHAKWEKYWGHGFVWIDKPRSIRQSVRYMVKYLQKTFEDMEHKYRNRYLCSQGLGGFETVYISNEKAEGTWFFVLKEGGNYKRTAYMEMSEEGIIWWEAWDKTLANE